MKKRLIHLISAVSWGGGERYALDLCRSFALKGWSVTAYTRDAKAVDTHFRQGGIDLRHAPLAGYLDIPTALLLARDLKHEIHGTIIHTHKFKDAFTALLARKLSRRSDIKVVMTRHLVRRATDGYIYRRIYRNLDSLIFVSDLARREFLKTWTVGNIPFNTKNISVIHNSIYVPQFELEQEPSNGPKIAMFHGRLSPEKGLETLIDALPVLKGKRTRLWLVGTGDPDYVDSLRRRALANDVMDIIDWKGYSDNVHSLISQCHFGILPSSAQEAFGLSNIEYMAHGKPQICTDNGAQTEYLIDGKEALMIPPGNVEALANAMLQLTQSQPLRTQMGENAYKKFYNQLSWNVFFDKMSKNYTKITD